MPAAFTRDLCRYRSHGKPNTSDASDKASVTLGQALFEVLGVPSDARGDEPTGTPLAERVAKDLAGHLQGHGLTVKPEGRLPQFGQYRHIDAPDDLRAVAEPSAAYRRAWRNLRSTVEANIQRPPAQRRRAEKWLDACEEALAADTAARQAALREIGSESLLKLDVTIANASPADYPELRIGLSLKWSLRTDRAQDCRSQGAKLSSLRRGRMPHFAAVTMEPRPYMLNLLAGGSGDVDCVYHLNLPALGQAVREVYGPRTDKKSRSTLAEFERLVEQGRLRDYDELVAHAKGLRRPT